MMISNPNNSHLLYLFRSKDIDFLTDNVLIGSSGSSDGHGGDGYGLEGGGQGGGGGRLLVGGGGGGHPLSL